MSAGNCHREPAEPGHSLPPSPEAGPIDRTAARAWTRGRRAAGLLLSALLACAPSSPAAAAPGPIPPGGADCQAALAAAGRQESDLLARAPGLQVVLLGETHTSAADHAWQLRTLEALAGRRRLSLGLEMVPAARQPVLERYGAGQLQEEAFLRQVGWVEVWGHDPDLYLPLLRWARRGGVPLLALNAEPEVVRRVRRLGLAAVPPAEREGIGMPAPVGSAYRKRLEAAWRGHGSFARPAGSGSADGPSGQGQEGGETGDLERFIDSQRLRDRAMAERIAAALGRDPRRLVVALIGRGHLQGDDGVPRQLQDLGLRRLVALVRPELPPGCGAAPARARLGAYLESEGGAVWVRRVAPGSAAEAAGIRPGDRILELNGTAVDHAGQVIRGVRLHPDGVPLRLTIERAGRRLRLELPLPPQSAPQRASRDNGPGVAPGVASAAGSPLPVRP